MMAQAFRLCLIPGARARSRRIGTGCSRYLYLMPHAKNSLNSAGAPKAPKGCLRRIPSGKKTIASRDFSSNLSNLALNSPSQPPNSEPPIRNICIDFAFLPGEFCFSVLSQINHGHFSRTPKQIRNLLKIFSFQAFNHLF